MVFDGCILNWGCLGLEILACWSSCVLAQIRVCMIKQNIHERCTIHSVFCKKPLCIIKSGLLPFYIQSFVYVTILIYCLNKNLRDHKNAYEQLLSNQYPQTSHSGVDIIRLLHQDLCY